MAGKSVLQEARDVQRAIELIELGARLQFIEAEVSLSRERLLRLYKEVKGSSPPKGLLPFSVDWYMTWMANIHASMFYNIYLQMLEHAGEDRLEALIKAFRLYQDQARLQGDDPVLDFTRAATLVKFFGGGMLDLATCTRCTGRFVTHAHENRSGYVCVLCRPPSRAGKKKRGAGEPEPGEAA
ncbi:flagellar transcriptional regulator FlhC [Ramlibacter sp. USB13]|uniref:Flagellar transcriptional regulator FlhC n=1 Tax=Ramlibacter cellulosilyticus TaxID=2764187 RepID=A0A923MWJ0_9BURK|nr:flagellar transcriptional regulator FlhC [Ramlibacter cellulosilyticus]MBC5785984.1 flagellar transcriptional regulator FlhC [Ramlibacter cellulosilyticus]